MSFPVLYVNRYLAEVTNLYGLHELHVQFGYEIAILAILHVVAHLIRYGLHDPTLLAIPAHHGAVTTLSGYFASILMVPIMLAFGSETIKRRLSFEVRKSMHMLAIPMILALCFHHRRMLWTCSFLLVVYGLDWAFSNLFKTYRIDAPHLFPIGSGTLVEFKSPPGFKFRSGQYVFVCAPYISKGEWHAFSVIPISHVDGSVACSFYALACGNWTKKLQESAIKNVRRPLWINGGYPSPFDTSVKYDYIFMICTGIGITPGISIISQYCYSKVIVLIWVCRDEELIELYRNELQVINTKVFHTGGKKSGGGNDTSYIEGSVVHCTGRPDLCGEIKNVILHKRPLGKLLEESTKDNVHAWCTNSF